MTVCVSDIIKMVEEIAPLHLAEDWDNSGLQTGSRAWEATKVAIALEPTEAVIDYACSEGAGMLITHHPMIFRPLKSVDFSSMTGRMIQKALENRMAIYAAHTNLDSAGKGLNDLLASKLGLKEVAVLSRPVKKEQCKLVFFVPTEQKNKILKALSETTAGRIGDYTCCSFLSRGSGTFRPGSDSTPFIGKPGEISTADEVRIETVVDRDAVDAVVSHLEKFHPYETMAYDIYPMIPGEVTAGLGRIGILPEETRLADFAATVKTVLGAGHVKFAGAPDLVVRKVALCTGSGGSLIKDFFKSRADVYLSGDLHYHDALTVSEKGLGMVDAGHFATEIIMAQGLREMMEKRVSELKMDVEFIVCPEERDPFTII